jgi:hypothetical protein
MVHELDHTPDLFRATCKHQAMNRVMEAREL